MKSGSSYQLFFFPSFLQDQAINFTIQKQKLFIFLYFNMFHTQLYGLLYHKLIMFAIRPIILSSNIDQLFLDLGENFNLQFFGCSQKQTFVSIYPTFPLNTQKYSITHMLKPQESRNNLSPNILSQMQKNQTQPQKQSIPASTQTDTQNLKQKVENIQNTTLQHTNQHHKTKVTASKLIWEEDQGQESQKQEALDLSGIQQQDQHSGDDQFVQDQYPSDYDADQDTYFQKSLKQFHSSQKNQEDSEWPQPLFQASPKQTQDDEVPVCFQLKRIEMQRFMTSQQFMDFINKDYLKKLIDHQQQGDSDDEKFGSKVNKSNNSQHKKVMFKDSVLIKRFKKNDQVHLITLVPQEIQYLNISDQIKSPFVQNQNTQISQTNKTPNDEKKSCEYSTRKEQIKTLDKVVNNKEEEQQALKAPNNHKYLKADEKAKKIKLKPEQHAQKIKFSSNTKVSMFKQKQNLKQNNQKQDLHYHPKKQTQKDEDNCIEIWSSLEERAIKLIK